MASPEMWRTGCKHYAENYNPHSTCERCMREKGMTLCIPDRRCNECQNMTEAGYKLLLAARQKNKRHQKENQSNSPTRSDGSHTLPATKKCKTEILPSGLQVYRKPSNLSNIAVNVIDIAKSDTEGQSHTASPGAASAHTLQTLLVSLSLYNLDVSNLNTLSVPSASKRIALCCKNFKKCCNNNCN